MSEGNRRVHDLMSEDELEDIRSRYEEYSAGEDPTGCVADVQALLGQVDLLRLQLAHHRRLRHVYENTVNNAARQVREAQATLCMASTFITSSRERDEHEGVQ